MNRILALDPGFVATGWAVISAGEVVDLGCIRTERSDKKRSVRVADDDARRCAVITQNLARVIGEHNPAAIIAELPHSGAKGARAIACMARAGAIVATIAEILAIPAEWVTPTDVKKITGSKAASKEDVEAAVRKRWPYAPLPEKLCEREHVADALGAYIAAERGQLVRLVNGTARATAEQARIS